MRKYRIFKTLLSLILVAGLLLTTLPPVGVTAADSTSTSGDTSA